MKQRTGIEILFFYQDFNNNWGTDTITIKLDNKYQNKKKFSTRLLTQKIKEQKGLKTVMIYNMINIYE